MKKAITLSQGFLVEMNDMNGKVIKTLFNGFVQKGTVQKVVLYAGNLPAGMYISQLHTANGVKQQKLVLEH